MFFSRCFLKVFFSRCFLKVFFKVFFQGVFLKVLSNATERVAFANRVTFTLDHLFDQTRLLMFILFPHRTFTSPFLTGFEG